MKREITALSVFSLCALFGCATRPPGIEYAAGPGPHAFDCKADPKYYQDFHIHAPAGKLRVTGLMQVVSVAEQPDPYWRSSVSIQFGSESEKPAGPYARLAGIVYPELRTKMVFDLRWGPEPSQRTPVFDALAIDKPIPFELTPDESYQLTASVGGTVKSIFITPFKVVRASLYCSGVHVRYSNVVVSAL